MNIKLILILIVSLISFFGQAKASYNINSVNSSWMSWTNYERNKIGIKELVFNEYLGNTAKDWSVYSKNRGYIDHKRIGQKSYYDFNKINYWFQSEGVGFKKVNGVTFSESIGRNNYFCNQSDCTESITNAVKKTFLMYMKEKGKAYAPHYNSMINKNFSQIGIGIIIDETKKKYYLTVHYGTEVVLRK